MKKVFLALILLATAVLFFGTKSYAAGTGNLVIHFQKWDGDYTDVGLFTWTGGMTSKPTYDSTDDFGIVFEYNDLPIATAPEFIVYFQVAGAEWWANKLTADVKPGAILVEDKTVHIYVFEGLDTKAANESTVLVADPDAYNMMLVYFDPSGNYEETLGVHAWNSWIDLAPAWATPAQVFVTVGKTSAGQLVKAAMLPATGTDAGLLVYAGADANKKTGDVTIANALSATPALGDVGVAYVVSKGDAYTANDNVYYNDPTSFAEESFSFKLLTFNNEEKTGTYAVDPNTIIVKTSAQITSPYPNAEDKDAARATIESWFSVREVTGVDTYGEPLAIERVDFATSNATLNSFVVILGDALDNTKEYEVFFDLGFPSETLTEAKEVEVTLNVTVPLNTPTDAVISAAGSFQGWTPNAVDYTATRVGTTQVYALTFTVDVTMPYTSFEYKWTRGDWPNAEFIAANRPLVIPNNVDSITFEDVVEAWEDIDAPAEKYAAPVRVAENNLSASLPVAMDTEAPVLTFISPSGIVGKVPAERIIDVAWGQPFNQNLFPRFRVVDDRDGDITPFVYVPKGTNSVLDTRTEGNYTIMLRVVDKWGNVTEETFIFRVAKSS